MSEAHKLPDGEQRTSDRRSSEIPSPVRTFDALNILAGSLGFVGSAVTGNDDSGLINVKPGLFLGAVAVERRT